MGKCPLCGECTNKPSTRLIKESCGHSKCRFCLINEESGCSVCEGNSGVASRLESIGNFDYHLPATTVPNYEELHSTPCKLDFNKIPDDFTDCPLDPAKLTLDNSINQNSDQHIVANIPGPEKVDIGTETEKIVAEKDVQSQTAQENTHSSLSQVVQTPMQPVTKVPEVFANTVSSNHQPHQEIPVAQNNNFIPVTQRADGRQFITIAFIANNSPNKNQQVVAPLLNQCLPSLANVTAIQRPGGNQCIPMIGNISGLQNGNQFIIRSPNIVQHLMGNQSMPVIGNLNTMQNLPGNQSSCIVGNANAVKNLVGNESLLSLPTINPMKSPTKGQSSPTAGSLNVTQKVVGNHLHQVAKLVPKEVEEQSTPVQENANTRRQGRTRGLPRIKTVKNVNIVQNPATNQSNKVRISRQIVKSPVHVKGKRKRKEQPVYLIPRKQNEQNKNPPQQVKSPTPKVITCMSPEYKLEDFVVFKSQQDETKDSEIQNKTIDDTQMINKPSESVINETPIVSDQFNGTVIEDKFIENKVDTLEQEGKFPNGKTNDEKSTEDVSVETDENKKHRDLNVVFNIREEENIQALNETVDNENEKIKIPSGEASNKDEYQNLDALFDIIEKESKKLNGNIFDKEGESDHTFNQEDNIEGEKNQNVNNGIDGKGSPDQHLNLLMDIQNKEIENLNEEICCNNEGNGNSLEINDGQEQNLVEELPIQNETMKLSDGEAGCKKDKHPNLDTVMKDHQEENEILDNATDNQFLNDAVVNGNVEEIQSLDEQLVGIEKENENRVNEDASLQEENGQYFDGGVMIEGKDGNENGVNDDENKSQSINEKIDNEETSNQTLYEDISDEEKENGELNNESQELPILTVENNDKTIDYEHSNENTVEAESQISNREFDNQDDETNLSLSMDSESLNENTVETESQIASRDAVDQDDETNMNLPMDTEHLNENTVEEESQITNREAVDQDEEINQSLTMETHEEETVTSSVDTGNALPPCETHDLNCSKLDATSQKDESIIVKKQRGRPKQSLFNYEQESEQSIAVQKDGKNLNTENDDNEGDENFVLETSTNEDEVMQENVNSNSTLAEMKELEDENAQFNAIKSRRGRKKKSFSDYELDIKSKSSNKNEQSLVKKPRGRPKKSLSNSEQSNKPNDSQEINQPALRELPNFKLKNNHKDNLDQSFEEEGQLLEVNAQIHNQEIDKNSMLNIHDKEESLNSTCIIKKSRGRPKIKNIPRNDQQKSLQSDVDAIDTFIEEDEPIVQKADTVNENEQSTFIKKPRGRPKKSTSSFEQPSQSDLSNINVETTVGKKPRGRPKKSLTHFEQHNESNVSQETEMSNVRESINDEESKEQHERNEGEESQILDREDFNQDETNEDSRIDEENLHTDVTTNITSNDKSDSDVSKSNIINENEPQIVAKNPRGRKKKSLSIFEQQIQPKVYNVNINEPTVIIKPRAIRPKKSLSNIEQQNESNVSQDTEISNVHEAINDEESREQHEKEESKESQTLDREDFSQDETLPNLSVNMDDTEQESLLSNDITNLTSSNTNESYTENTVNESSMTTKKPRGRPKKILTNNEQPSQSDLSVVNAGLTVKKSRGRPKKSLSMFKQQNGNNVSQETKMSNVSEAINDEESKDQYAREEGEKSQTLGREEFSQDETLQQSSVDMDDAEPETHVSYDIANLISDNNIESDIKNTENESPIMTNPKPKGRPKKSLTNSEPPSHPDVPDVSVEPTVVKKSRGKPKKSLAIFEQQHQLVSLETELSNMTEILSLGNNVNDEDGKEQEKVEENQDLNREDFETSPNSIVNINNGEKENLHSDVVASLTSNESDGKAPETVYENEQITIIKIPKKSLNSSEQRKDPIVSNAVAQTVVVKKSRGRPKKSLSNLEQPNVPTNSNLDGENNNEKDQAQYLNGEIDKEEKKLPHKEDSHDDKNQSLSTSLHTENDESSILETEVKETSNQNSIDGKLETRNQSEQTTIIKKARGRPRKEKPQGPLVKKQRGRPRKANYEQQNESNLLQSKEYETETERPSFSVNYSKEKDEQQSLDGNVTEDESRILDSEDDDREESSQMEIPDDENRNLVDGNEKDQGNDFVQSEDMKIKVVSTLSNENDEDQTQQQNCNEFSNNEPADVEEKDSQGLKSQDDENKENKKEYSEKDEATTEYITPATEEQDLEKSTNADSEVPKNNTTGRKYKKFDAINTQVIVESSKRKRKPKVLLYENEDLDISPLTKKKKELNKSAYKNVSKISDKKSQVDNSTHTNETMQNSENTNITVKWVNVKNQLQENEKRANINEVELGQNVNEYSMDTDMNESNISTTASSSKNEDSKSMKRNRRPKNLLYESEDLRIKSKNMKKKNVEFSLPVDEDSIDSDNIEKDDGVTALEVYTNKDELPTKKSERIKKPKILLYKNGRLSFTSVKEKNIKSEIEKEDLMIMKKFEIKLEPIIVLERIIDLSIIKKYEPEINSLQKIHGNKKTVHPKNRKSTIEVKRPRGRPKLSNEPTASKNKSTSTKVLASKRKKLQMNTEKRRPGRPSKDYSHIIKQPGEPPTYQCTICSLSFKHYANRNLHSKCVTGSQNSTMKMYKCELCPKKFYHKAHWEYHLRKHKGEKPFRCELCGKMFLQKGKLNRHSLIHKYTQDLECNECGKKFVSKDYLKSHLLSHVKSSFVFRCNQCPKAFTADSNRRRHELSHSPVALFKCQHCLKSFKTKFEVNKHTKIHQKARPFACDTCGKAFLTKFEVKRHTIAHTGEKNYTCSRCGQKFGRIDNYNRHMLHHHPVPPGEDILLDNTNSITSEVRPATPVIEEKKPEKKKDKSPVKPKKISRTPSNPVPTPISFIQPLTPQSVPSPYTISQNHELASVIHETLPDLNNAVPVISVPLSVQPSLSLMDPIPLEQALVLNRQIEEKIYTQNSFCEFPGLTRRTNITLVDHDQRFSFERRNSSENNSNSNDGASFLTMNQNHIAEEQEEYEMSPTKKDIHVHWRRRTAETFKSQIDQNK